MPVKPFVDVRFPLSKLRNGRRVGQMDLPGISSRSPACHVAP